MLINKLFYSTFIVIIDALNIYTTVTILQCSCLKYIHTTLHPYHPVHI